MRHFFLAAYDVTSPKRLRKILNLVRGYSSGGQKSAFECYLSNIERQQLLTSVNEIINVEEDKFILVRISQRKKCFELGIANISKDNDFICIG